MRSQCPACFYFGGDERVAGATRQQAADVAASSWQPGEPVVTFLVTLHWNLEINFSDYILFDQLAQCLR